ncbi:MAG TPA: HAMP domain-containing histidine kinase [Rheinheimera sp.]|uniref:HAMP domain-containing sensor histidine kinase n=1 Tax=Rheinheimera sp. TaxID=1869214 RepID=UPI000EEDC626|nr:sensor histidine kinase [Rheinheimera sp.]HCU67286.1 HAMP domain-containing histidine kinase [Rheinheimera sp.]
MKPLLRTTSIKGALSWVVMLICSVTLLASLTISSLQDISFQKRKLVDQLHAYANIVAFNSKASILYDDAEMEDGRLKSFAAVDILHNIHIYKLTAETNQLTFFSSYNRRDVGPHPTQFDKVDELLEPHFDGDVIELTKAVDFEGKKIGYIYLRASLTELNKYMQNRILFDLLIAIIALLCAFFVSVRLQRRFTKPIEALLAIVQKVTKEKSYSVRAPAAEIEELHMLGRAINNMLDRIEQQFNKVQQAEQEIRQLNQGLEQKINERTLALKSSNQDLLNTLETLHQYQNQIVETEKMASLGQMVAGVAHEVNTPIGLGVTASTLMQDKLADIQKAFDEKKLTSNQLAKFLSESGENLGIIYRNLERAASLIRSFKQVAVDQSNENRRTFNMLQLMNEVLLSLRPNLKKTQHQVLLECDPGLEIDSKPGPINQILINLIMNSLIHAFEHIEQGTIKIQVKVEHSRCFIHYSDNGAGVPENIKKRIFDPFVTTKRGEGGSGLGMHLVYNLVTQALNGKISLESSLGEGVHILFDFPVVVKASAAQTL